MEDDVVLTSTSAERVDSAEVDRLLAMLQKESGRRERRRKIGFAMLAAYFVLLLLSLFHGAWHVDHNDGLLAIGLVFVFVATHRQRKMLTELAEYDDIRAVGPLTDALGFKQVRLGTLGSASLVNITKVAGIAEAKLSELLPRMRASDAHLLNPEQRRNLCAAVQFSHNVDFVVGALRAFEQIGGEDVLVTVEKLANREPRSAGARQIRQAAEEALPAVRQRAEQAQSARILLRPASSPEGPAEVLLRPAQGPGATDESVLLRAVDTDSG